MNDYFSPFGLLINDALDCAEVPSAADVWKRAMILPLILLFCGGTVFLFLLAMYKMHYYCVIINVSLFFLTLFYGCSFSFKVIYKLILVSFLKEESISKISTYINNALKKSLYLFALSHVVAFVLSMIFAVNLSLSGFAMLMYFAFTFASIRIIYSFFLLDAQRFAIPFAGHLASKFINSRGRAQ